MASTLTDIIGVLRRWLSIRTLRYLLLLPRIRQLLVNWPSFLQHYLIHRHGDATYRFRSGIEIHDIEGYAAGTIAVVFIRKHYGSVRKLKTILDVGANIGVFSLFAAVQSRDAKIFSCEPVPSNYALLKANITRNKLDDRITAFNLSSRFNNSEPVDVHLSIAPSFLHSRRKHRSNAGSPVHHLEPADC